MVARSLWKGSITWGMVSIAVKLFAATSDRDIRFHQVHKSDGARIRTRKFCEAEDREVGTADIAKGYELPSGEVVILDRDDFAHVPLPSAHEIAVEEFVPGADIDPIQYSKAYYAQPDKQTKPYVLLRDSLAETGLVGLVKIAMRQKEHLAVLRPTGNLLVLHTMLWPDEVKKPSTIDDSGLSDVKLSKQEMQMASQLVSSMSSETLDLSGYHDDYRKALMKVIDAKANGDETIAPPEGEGEGGKVIDLMAALEASLNRTKGGKRKPAKKPAAKKAAAKKPAAKKARKAA